MTWNALDSLAKLLSELGSDQVANESEIRKFSSLKLFPAPLREPGGGSKDRFIY